jgi:glycosyltransferase involved in cell wall biosynthesis
VLWSTGDPWSGLVIGEKLSRRFDIPWVADFRDPWTLCEVRTDGKPEWTHMMDQRHERRVLGTADRVLFQARQTEANYRAHYPSIRNKTSTIYNSYDPDVFDDPVRLDAARPHAVSEGQDLHIGFFGRFRAMSPATLIIDVLSEAHRRHGGVAGRIKIHPFGPLNADDERLSKERGVFEQFEPAPAVPLEKSLDVLGRFDILLVSTDQRRDEIIPAKLLEYLAAARPILSMSANPEVGGILEKTGAGIQPGPDAIEAVADLLVECVASKEEGVPLPIPFRLNAAEVTRFDARTTTQELAAVFDDVLTARLRPASA